MALLTAKEVFQFAARIEENGERFYRAFAENLTGSLEKELFVYLANEEVTHKKTFEDLSDSIQDTKPTVGYPDEYSSYLQAYTDNLIFMEDTIKKEVVKIKNAKEACEFGIRRELDSILYYQEIKDFLPEKERDHIDTIIGEERQHFIKLSEMKKKFEQNS
ncbi:MAG: ferritin family protein [Spirochaetota bacterium]|nr:MAG: ferritin family protein [Spirochaetota bacterium]